MTTINLKNLESALRETDVLKLPEMNGGTAYLYEKVYRKMSKGSEVRLSELDFGAFEPEDVWSLNSLYSDVFEKNCHTSNNIAETLRTALPICKSVGYV